MTTRIRKLVAARYQEGPFAWASLFGHRGDDVACCSQCLNHIRKRRGIRRKEMLPMDHFLLSLLNPGLIARFRAPSNLYFGITKLNVLFCLVGRACEHAFRVLCTPRPTKPGHTPMVDRRSARRLWATLRNECNRFRHTGVWPLESILSSDRPINAWWLHNLSTPFFRDKHAARLVRLELDR